MQTNSLTIAEGIEDFFNDSRLAPQSKEAYRYSIAKFVGYLTKILGVDVASTPVDYITTHEIVGFARYLLPADVNSPEEVSRANTARHNLAAVSTFAKYLIANGLCPELDLKAARRQIRPLIPSYVSPPPPDHRRDIERLVKYVRSQAPIDRPQSELRRQKILAMILALYETGIRVSDLCALKCGDISFEQRTLTLIPSKREPRSVIISPELVEAFRQYWQRRGDPDSSYRRPAISGKDVTDVMPTPISPRTVEYLVAQLCVDLKITTDITPASFRHALVRRLLERGEKTSTIQQRLGFTSSTAIAQMYGKGSSKRRHRKTTKLPG